MISNSGDVGDYLAYYYVRYDYWIKYLEDYR